MTNLSTLDQALHDADDKEVADALRYLGRAERIAAALNAQAVERNRADLMAEDIEAFHLALDKHGVPRADEAGAVFSMYGRALRLNQQAGVVEALRPLEEKLETYQQSCWTLTDSLMAIELAEAARAALAAINGGKP